MESFCDLVNLENAEFLDRKQIEEDTILRLSIGCPGIFITFFQFKKVENGRYRIKVADKEWSFSTASDTLAFPFSPLRN